MIPKMIPRLLRHLMPARLRDMLLELCGLMCILGGVSLWSLPLALILTGVVLFWLAQVVVPRGGSE